ncbi:MAG: hypothetical protein KDA46_06440 [Parvularculaceae bacterium]|nr:hypothetical protein [Parvularculaceae bacterium]
MRKSSLLSVIACVGFCVGAPAYAGDLSINTTSGFESRYIFRGVQFAETSIQPAVTINYSGLHLGAWFNLPVGDDDFAITPGGEELDLVIGYSFPLTDYVGVDAGLTYYLFPDAMSGFGDFYKEDGNGGGVNSLEPYVSFSFSAPLSPVVTFYRDFMWDTFTIQGSLSHSAPLGDGLSLDLGGMLGYVVDDDPADYLYGVANANISYQFSDKSSIYAGARYGGSDIPGGSFIDNSIAGTSKSNGFWWGVGFSTSL